MTTRKQLRLFRHNIFFIKLHKIGLSPFNIKGYILSKGCVTLACGHYALRQDNLDQHDQE